jgi:hypothetical protein
LALLLSMAAHDPQGLVEIAARHAVVGYQHREFVFNPDDFDDQIDEGAAARVPARGKPTKPDTGRLENTPPLADPNRFHLKDVVVGKPGEPVVAGGGGKLKAPVSEEPETGDKGSKSPPDAKARFSNMEIEAAARPFIEEYELGTRGCDIVRQGANVGADYVASDGRYIEVKAFGGAAPDSFEMEATEWRAAQKEGLADRYWVYVVEHLRDEQPPRITAVFNPVLDEATAKEPTGKLRIRGWKSSAIQRVGEFTERTPDATQG